MFLIDENQLGFGIPIDFNGICWIYPLTIREILNISQEQFQKYLSLLTITKDDINKITNNEFDGSVFKYLLFQSYYSDTFLMDLKKAFSTFIKEEITFSFETEEIIIGEDFKEKRVIKEDNFEDFQNSNQGEYYYFTRYGTKPYSEIDFSDSTKNIYLIFGKESTGIPKEILHNNLDRCYRIPITDNIRALNLSNCVALVTYEALRQEGFPNLLTSDPFKGEDYLKKE